MTNSGCRTTILKLDPYFTTDDSPSCDAGLAECRAVMDLHRSFLTESM